MIFGGAVGASAALITYSTDSSGTGFLIGSGPGTTLSMSNSSGAAATLVFTPDGSQTVGTPTNGNYGYFTLSCPTCSTQAQGTVSSYFSAFTFDLVITDITDNASGEFVGAGTAGQVWSNSSPVIITWNPTQLGPNATAALTGNFGSTDFNIQSTTRIVDPADSGITTVQGTMASAPEPATFGLIGFALVGLGLYGRKKLKS
jgi:hypothetical protein